LSKLDRRREGNQREYGGSKPEIEEGREANQGVLGEEERELIREKSSSLDRISTYLALFQASDSQPTIRWRPGKRRKEEETRKIRQESSVYIGRKERYSRRGNVGGKRTGSKKRNAWGGERRKKVGKSG